MGDISMNTIEAGQLRRLGRVHPVLILVIGREGNGLWRVLVQDRFELWATEIIELYDAVED